MDNLEDRFFLGPGLFSGANLLFVSGSVSFDNPCWWLMKTAQALMRLKQKIPTNEPRSKNLAGYEIYWNPGCLIGILIMVYQNPYIAV